MKLQQLRYVAEVVRRGLNVSEAAEALHTSQPGVSKQIRALEDELGSAIFIRQGKRLTTVTDAGREIVATIDRILAEVANLRAVGREFADHAKGTLAVGVTHTQARYALPPEVTPLTLEAIAGYPLVTYDPTFAGRTALDRTFAARGLHPEIALTALDSDVIKSYVSLGLGVGIVSERAFRAS